ncbi:MAG: hypothetical protein NT135_02735, partial [Candidatus Berkelbacteria bacterium]|nr:hypothetical protein [Candidatus Berkelbacteria bacterium]
MKNKWLLFGAGGIGRGLVAQVAGDSQHDLIFVSSSKEKAQFFLKHPKYQIILYSSVSNSKKRKNISILDAIDANDINTLTKICSSPDLKIISTSVRVDNLESVAKNLAPALKNRKGKLIILVCENIEQGGDKFKKMLESQIKGVTKNLIIPNISIDCMIPPHKSNTLKIEREDFGLILIEEPKDKEAIDYLKKLPNAKLIKGSIEKHYKRKIIGVSGLHAGIAWLGYSKGLQYVFQAAQNPQLKKTIDGLAKELGEAIFEVTGFPKIEITKYLNEARTRVGNKHLLDPNDRFFRNLRNKLNKNERFLEPALIIWKKKIFPKALLTIVSIGIKKLIKDENLKDTAKVVKEVCQ